MVGVTRGADEHGGRVVATQRRIPGDSGLRGGEDNTTGRARALISLSVLEATTPRMGESSYHLDRGPLPDLRWFFAVSARDGGRGFVRWPGIPANSRTTPRTTVKSQAFGTNGAQPIQMSCVLAKPQLIHGTG